MLVQQAQFLGLDPVAHHELMWLAELALTPDSVPSGWLRCTAVGAVGGVAGREYYFHAATGMAMWEHPQVAFLGGVAKRLQEARVQEARALAAQRGRRGAVTLTEKRGSSATASSPAGGALNRRK